MTINKFCLSIMMIFLAPSGFAASPILNIAAVVKAPRSLPSNTSAEAVYRITNNTSKLHSFVMQNIRGITQITTTTGACSNPISLNKGQSCLLNLRIRGNEIPPKIQSGPVVCNNNANPFGCSQPANASDTLNITVTLAESYAESNTWISVLVADEESPPDQVTYVNKIYTLAPSAEQIHLRVVAGANGCPATPASCQTYADLIAKLRTKYTNHLLIGFHPDDSKSSYTDWGCAVNDWQCVLNASIVVMNAINAIANSGGQTGQGFNIFSLEQSYAVPADSPTLRNVKACLNPPEAASDATCPTNVTHASPVVKFGWVLPSYGGCVITVPPTPCDNEYGTDALDYGYPQYYNLGTPIGSYTALITNGYFPTYSTTCISHSPYPNPLYIVDEDNGDHPYNPEIPCPASGQSTSNVFTYPDPTTGTPPNIDLASAYIAYIMTQLPPISDIPTVNGSTVYVTFSGEGLAQAPSEFLGAPGWTLQSILQFYNGINANFGVLYGLYPPPNTLFNNGVFANGVNPSAIKYGIWNFSSILDNIPG